MNVELIKSWVVNDREVDLFRINDRISCKVTDTKTGNIQREYLTLTPGKSIEENVLDYKSAEVIFGRTVIPRFSIPCHKWTTKNKEIGLHLLGSQFICRIYDTTTKKCHYIEKEKIIDYFLTSNNCSAEVKLKFEKLVDNINKIELLIKKLKEAQIRYGGNKLIEITNKRIKENAIKSANMIISFLKDFKISCMIDSDLSKEDSDFWEKKRVFDLQMQETYQNIYKTAGASIFSLGLAIVCPPLGILALSAGAAGTASLGVKNLKQDIIRDNYRINERLALKRYNKRVIELKSKKLPFLFEIEPISQPSQVDERVLVSKFTWAVTLICRGGPDGSHASIIVEGLNNGDIPGVEIGKYFLHKSDLHSQNFITSQLLKKNLMFDRRTQIWKVTNEKAITLLKNIQEDIRKIDEVPGYNIEFAKYFPGPKEHNCFTWAREKLKEANIVDLGTKTFLDMGLFPARAKNYTPLGQSSYLGLGIPFSPSVLLNNFEDEYNYSESAIVERESV